MGYPSSLQKNSIGRRDYNGYARYGGRGRGRGPGRGSYPSKEYSDYRYKGHQSTKDLETQGDITIDTDLEKSENW